MDPCHKLSSLRSALIVIDIYRVEEALLNCSCMECCLDGRLSSALSSHAVIPSPSILCHFKQEKFTSVVTVTELMKEKLFKFQISRQNGGLAGPARYTTARAKRGNEREAPSQKNPRASRFVVNHYLPTRRGVKQVNHYLSIPSIPLFPIVFVVFIS